MTTVVLAILIGLGTAVPRAEAGSACQCRFEVAGGHGVPLAVRRATRSADGGACAFDVRLRVADPEECTGARAVVRGAAAGRTTTTWGESWERVVMPRAGRRVLRGRLRGETGGSGRARLTLRCRARTAIEGCEAVEGESTSCYLGGHRRIRVAGLDTGAVCPAGEIEPRPELVSENLAVWNGRAYTCPGDSVSGAFVATPPAGGDSKRIAGPCAAVTTDGESLYVLPHPGFDAPGSVSGAFAAALPQVAIRAYDLPDAVPAGPYRVAFDPATIPADSVCSQLAFRHLAAQDGYIYAAGCRPSRFAGCAPAPVICVFDTRTGDVLPPLALEDFTGLIRGMSALPDGRLLILTDDQASLPPIGYAPNGGEGQRPAIDTRGLPPLRIHAFDAVTGKRLDTRTIDTAFGTGLSCRVGLR
jgi:hypothetical protein